MSSCGAKGARTPDQCLQRTALNLNASAIPPHPGAWHGICTLPGHERPGIPSL